MENRKRKRAFDKLPFAEVDPLIEKLCKILDTNIGQVCRTVGLTDSAYYGWRTSGEIGRVFKYAFLGLLAELDLKEEKPKPVFTQAEIIMLIQSFANRPAMVTKLAAMLQEAPHG